MTEIIKIKGDWEEVVNDCRSTVGKPALGSEPSHGFKKDILIAEHSPIRDISVKWRWSGMKSWIATHWARHKWEKYITTQRTDRTGIPRDELPQAAPVDFVGEANAQHLIDTFRKRLCGSAAEETRHYAEDFKFNLFVEEPELSDVLVPNCVYRSGCPEMKPCGYWADMIKWVKEELGGDLLSMPIKKRYAAYALYFGAHQAPEVILRADRKEREEAPSHD